MEREIEVWLGDGAAPSPLGTLWSRFRSGRDTASFEYARAWIEAGYTIDPAMPLGGGRFHTERAMFGAFTDPAPDRWGQTLLRRHERVVAKREGRAVRTLTTLDFLLHVDDETRLGALRFRERGATTFATVGRTVPPLVQLPKLLRASAAIVADEETEADLAMLLAPGTSLGGARPKASVREVDGSLAIAKFPSRDDDWPITRWEATTLTLAEAAGITVPAHRIETPLGKPVLVIARFDRRPGRIHYCSAMTMLAAGDGDLRSYIEIADALRIEGARIDRDLAELWRRVVFNILVSNTDDHLRNHGFLRADEGWILAPAFDLNPMPVDVRPRVHALAIDETDPTSSLDSALATIGSYGLSTRAANAIVREVSKAVRRWRSVAKANGLSTRQVERMESAFEHDDAKRAAKI